MRLSGALLLRRKSAPIRDKFRHPAAEMEGKVGPLELGIDAALNGHGIIKGAP